MFASWVSTCPTPRPRSWGSDNDVSPLCQRFAVARGRRDRLTVGLYTHTHILTFTLTTLTLPGVGRPRARVVRFRVGRGLGSFGGNLASPAGAAPALAAPGFCGGCASVRPRVFLVGVPLIPRRPYLGGTLCGGPSGAEGGRQKLDVVTLQSAKKELRPLIKRRVRRSGGEEGSNPSLGLLLPKRPPGRERAAERLAAGASTKHPGATRGG